mmetsp:Transcript_87902/g.137709  ORF Transcript_87902/g.137709 Transcript_87902/m.137709 type:complete len:473 (-) Transcript_87902:11-1429(-)
MSDISTVCISGFPGEAQARELKNLCRFMQGFEGAHVVFVRDIITTLFVKFEIPDLAHDAIKVLNGIPFDIDAPSAMLKAEVARRELEVRANPLPAPLVTPSSRPWEAHRAVARPAVPMSSPPALTGGSALAGGHAGYVQGLGVARHGNTGGELVTITILGLTDKQLVLEDLLSWFQDRPGFVALQVNERIDGIFAKFRSQIHAEQAIHDANALNFGAEWARRNLDDDAGVKSAPALAPYGGPHAALHHSSFAGGYGGDSRSGYAPRSSSNSGSSYSGVGYSDPIVTITVLGIREKGLSLEELQEWFTTQPGFVAMQMNERIDGIFVKYSTAERAQEVMVAGNEKFAFAAEWARRNLDDDKSTSVMPAFTYPAQYGGAAHASQPSHGSAPWKRQRHSEGEKNTVCILGMKEKGLNTDDLQRWFRDLPGFVTLQVNDRIDALFVKFSSHYDAEYAMASSNDRRYGVEWARRNLD